MATPISMTWLQLQNLSGGSSCKTVLDTLTPLYPGLNDATVMDVLTLAEQYRTAGITALCLPSLIRGMTGAQQKSFIVWALGQLSSRLPVGWSRTATLQSKITDLIDCINTPTAGKKTALQTFSSSLTIDYTDNRDALMADLVKRAINLTVAGTTTAADSWDITALLIHAAVLISGSDRATVNGAVLTQIETIIGVI